MRILHTSDWHLDHRLYEHHRLEEHARFLNWLREIIVKEQINALIVSGDIFDNRGPTHEAQDLYFKFLPMLYSDFQTGKSVCHNIVIIAGNHDSVSFLERTKPLMQYLKISVVGSIPQQSEDWSDLILELKNGKETEAIVLALPFITEAEMNNRSEGKTIQEKRDHSIDAFLKDWQTAADLCVARRNTILKQIKKNSEHEEIPYIPIISTGHLFAREENIFDKNKDKNDLRVTSVGNLGLIPGNEIPKEFDYVALGHLHIPQLVCDQDHVRYSGSPIPIAFDEAKQAKNVVIVDWKENGERIITPVDIPVFQKLVQITGDWDSIVEQINALDDSDGLIWLEIQYTDTKRRPTIGQDVAKLIENRNLDICSLTCPKLAKASMSAVYKGEKLESLNPREVFQRVLNESEITGTESEELKKTYEEALKLCEL